MNTSSILLIIISTIAALFAFLFFTFSNKQSKAVNFLGGYMILVFFQILLKYFESTGNNIATSITYLFIIPIMLASLPFLFFYAQRLTIEHFKFANIKYLHFIPALLVLFINIFTYGQLSSQDMQNLQNGIISNPDVSFLIDAYVLTYKTSQYVYDIQAITYGFIMLFLFNRHRINISNRFSFKENISLSWLQIFVFVFITVAIAEVLLYAFTSYMLGQRTQHSISTALRYISVYDNMILYLMLGYTLFLGFFGIRQADIYTKTNVLSIPNIPTNKEEALEVEAKDRKTEHNEVDKENLSEETPELTKDFKEKKYTIPEELKNKIHSDIIAAMVSKKLYLNRHLTLDDLAAEIRVNKNYVSAVINEKFGKNFYHYVNELRIEAAKNLLVNPLYNYLSIEGIAQSVGFNSKSVFNPAFKKHTGMTPSEYKRKN